MHDTNPIENPAELTSGNFLDEKNPYTLFSHWFAEAQASELNDPNAMTLATVDGDGLPDARIVLLKDVNKQGFAFYTNTQSAKGNELAQQPRAALVFHWKSLRKQVRVRGAVVPVSVDEADAYFASRARDSQIGAWASQQSRPLANRGVFDAAFEDVQARFDGQPVPRPPHWSGFRVEPQSIEFWHDRPFRLHDRGLWSLQADGSWNVQRLYP